MYGRTSSLATKADVKVALMTQTAGTFSLGKRTGEDVGQNYSLPYQCVSLPNARTNQEAPFVNPSQGLGPLVSTWCRFSLKQTSY